MVTKGCVVSVPATYFDNHDDNNWSQQLFGERWSTARCSGFVQRVYLGNQWCRVKWDIDGAVSRTAVCDLQIDEQPHIEIHQYTGISSSEEVSEARQGTSGQEQTPDFSAILSSSCTASSSKSSNESSEDEISEPSHGRKLCYAICNCIFSIIIATLSYYNNIY